MGSRWDRCCRLMVALRTISDLRQRGALIRGGPTSGSDVERVGATSGDADLYREDGCGVTRDGDMAGPSPVASCAAESPTPAGVKGAAIGLCEDSIGHSEDRADEGGTEGHVVGAFDQLDVCAAPALQLTPIATDGSPMDEGDEMNDESVARVCEGADESAGACPPCDRAVAPAWTRRRHRRMGHCAAHARFLQHLFRGYRRIRPGGWRAGGLAGCPLPYRPCTVFRCRGGMCGAADSDFEEQQRRAEEVLGWYSIYPDLLARLENRRPRTYHPYCAAGADAAGVQRARGIPYGSDIEDQPAFRMKFGSDSFAVRDATQAAVFFQAVDRVDPTLLMMSPPCKSYSTADFQGRSDAPELIGLSRDLGKETGRLFAIENVKGAASEFEDHAILMYGSYFGLHVDKPRFFEANFPLIVDEYIETTGRLLRTRACLGRRRRWRRLDPFGRPELTDCCDGNLFPIQGTSPVGFSLGEAAHAMGVDEHHMPFERLAQAIPPAYAQLVFSQACMERCRQRFGVPAITFDEMRLDPTRCRKTMAFWLRGAGNASPDAGLAFYSPLFAGPVEGPGVRSGVEAGVVPLSAHSAAGEMALARSPTLEGAAAGHQTGLVAEGARVLPADEGVQPSSSAPMYAPRHRSGAEVVATPLPTAGSREAAELVREVEFREVFYSRHGGYDQVCSTGTEPESTWLRALRPQRGAPDGAMPLDGASSLIVTRHDELRVWLDRARGALGRTRGTRVVLQVPVGGAVPGTSRRLREAGFSEVRRCTRGVARTAVGDTAASLPAPWVWWAAGDVWLPPSRPALDLDAAERGMDPRDQGLIQDDAEAKAARPFLPVEHDPAKWFDTGLPPWIEEMMQSGVRIQPVTEPPMADHPFYRWESAEAHLRAIQEADRHLLVGSLEYVPESEVAWTAANCVVHPWVVVRQGEKWRLCHDYSVGINRFVPTVPFRLPTPWDVRSVLVPTSHFAKYDIRDGFFHVPIHPDSRHHMVVRHPGTGGLMRGARLPFGYIESPHLFCGLTEAIADKLRKRCAGKGIHFYVFVDDFLVVGDTEELTLEGCSMLEGELFARGIEWAPHKHRGPATSMEFLGLLLAVVDGEYFISLTRKRRDKLLSLIDEWLEWEAAERRDGRSPRAPPKEVASLLGRLVFASQVVHNGRTFMQAMLAAFKGCVVDWRRGSVTFSDNTVHSSLHLDQDFWVDVRWWRDHLRDRYSVRWREEEPAEAAIVGTDASGWGTGQLAWLDGGREEVQLEFTEAERRRPINWRELLGVLRTVDFYGPRLQGLTVLLETDNMAAKGAASKRASKAKDMQELVRRLVCLCEQFDITLRLTHTPGLKLDRPDQTSRGDPVEEPRLRLRRPFFSAVERRWGHFTSFVGAERAWGSRSVEGRGEMAWMHATHATVGSALRLLADRATQALETGQRFRAVAVVPDGSGAALDGITRHMAPASRVPAGSRVLESFGAGTWRPVPAHRGLTLFVYPRAAGDAAMPVVVRGQQERAAVDTLFATGGVSPLLAVPGDEERWYVPVLPGAFLYRPGEGDARGSLFWVDASYHPRDDLDVLNTERVDVRMALRTGSRIDVQKLGVETYDVKSDGQVVGVAAEGLWIVSHLIGLVDQAAFIPQRPRESVENYSKRCDGMRLTRYTFDWRTAHREIARASQSMAPQAAHLVQGEWVLVEPMGSPASSLDQSEPGRESTGSSVVLLGDPLPEPPAPSRSVEPAAEAEEGTAAMAEGAASPAAPAEGSGDSLSAALRGLRLETPPSASQRPSLAMAMERQPPGQAPAAGRSSARPYPGTRCSYCGLELGGEGVIVLGFMVHRSVCAPAVEARERSRLSGVGSAMGQTPLSLQEALRASPRPSAGASTPPTPSRTSLDAAAGARARVRLSARASSESPATSAEKPRPDRPVVQRRESREQGLVVGGSAPGDVLRRTRAEEDLSPMQIAAVKKCLDGRCDEGSCRFQKTKCKTCDRGLHVAECASLGTARAALGVLKCMYCRCHEMAPNREPTESLMRTATESMLIHLSTGAETTAKVVADFNRLEQQFVLEKGLNDLEEALPRHNPESFINFLTWVHRDAGRARSMDGMWRSISLVFSAQQLPNLTDLPAVKAHYKEMQKRDGTVARPAAHLTKRAFGRLVRDVIPAEEKQRLIRSRYAIQVMIEVLCGTRIGEVADSGQGHGVHTGSVRLVTEKATGKQMIDILIDGSKTGHMRYTGCVAICESGVDAGAALREYWAAWQLPLMIKDVGAYTIQYADWWVVRVGLKGVQDWKLLDKALALASGHCPMIRLHLDSILNYTHERIAASGGGSEIKKFVNVAGGREGSIELDKVVGVLRNHGFTANLVPAPFLFATTGGARAKATLMPIASSSVSGNLSKHLKQAAIWAASDPSDPDPDCNMTAKELKEANLASHACRRCSDTEAQRYSQKHGIDTRRIDMRMGWKEAELSRDMLVHYENSHIKLRWEAAMLSSEF